MPSLRLRLGTGLRIGLVLALLGSASCARVVRPESRVEHTVRVLAGEEYEGRFTGSAGARRAADFLADALEGIGAVPLAADFRVPFEFAAGAEDTGSSLALDGRDEVFAGESQIRALGFSSPGAATGRVVFAGYGLVVPGGHAISYDSYAGLDVRDKLVLVLRWVPEDLPQEQRALLSRYAGLRTKAMLARERGALGLLVVAGPRSPRAGLPIGMSFDAAVSGSGILAASISGGVADALFAGSKDGLEQIQAELDVGNPHAGGFELPGVVATLDARLTRRRERGQNVIAVLPATAADRRPERVVVGAHYDHLGRGVHGNSLARDSERGRVHAGADDNASGVAAVLEIGARLASTQRRRDVVLAFWSGEELGLLGSGAALDAGLLRPEEVAAYVNFDMVGRVQNDRLMAQATGSSPAWPEILERSNLRFGFDLSLLEDPYLPTDSASFDRADVPNLNFFSGAHADYHRPSDVADRVSYAALERVAGLGAAIVHELARAEAPPGFHRVERRSGPGGDRDSLRAYTGTIPDYAVEVEGLALAGVVEGGPASEAGLREGDVIVKLGSQSIANIYDYTYALDAVRIGEPVPVVFLRDGERRETSITPRARR